MRDFFQVTHRYQIPIYIEPEKKKDAAPPPTKTEALNLNIKQMFIPMQNPQNINIVQMRTN